MPQNSHVQNVLALSIVVIIDWLVAHLANNWVMPPEVAQAFQTIVSVAIGAYVARKKLVLPDAPDTPTPAAPVVTPPVPTPSPPAPSLKPEASLAAAGATTTVPPTAGTSLQGHWPPNT